MGIDEELPKYTPRRAPTEPPGYTPYVQHSKGSYEPDVITQEGPLPRLSPASRAQLQNSDAAPAAEPKEHEATPPKKDDAYE